MRALGIVLVVAVSLPTVGMGQERAEAAKPRLYQTPQAVFDAYRGACAKRDWRAAYSCMTPTAKAGAVYEAYYLCQILDREPKVVAIADKYELKSESLHKDYAERYQKKHGVDPRLPLAPTGSEPKKVAGIAIGPKGELIPTEMDAPEVRPPLDQELFAESVCAGIKDGAGLYEEVKRATERENGEQVQRMDGVSVQGDSAVGRVTLSFATTVIARDARGLTTTTQTPHTRVADFHFRKLNGSWLLGH